MIFDTKVVGCEWQESQDDVGKWKVQLRETRVDGITHEF
jgi:hypothetical protein